MKKTIVGILLLSFQCWGHPSVKKADLFRTLSFPHSCQISIFDQKANVTSDFILYFQKQDALASQTAPAKAKDRKMLMKGSDIWMFTPNIKRPIRISLDQRLAGDISNGDILSTNFAEDYNAEEIKEPNAPADVLVFMLTKKSDTATYAKIKYFLQRSTLKPIKSIFYAVSGKELKTAQYLDYKKILGQEIFTKVKIQDLAQGQASTITYSNHKKQKFPESFFNKDAVVNF